MQLWKKGLYCYMMMFLNFMKINNPTGLTPVIFPLGNSYEYNFFFTSKREKGRQKSLLGRETCQEIKGLVISSQAENEKGLLRAPSFSFWGKVLFWQAWLQLSFFAGCSGLYRLGNYSFQVPASLLLYAQQTVKKNGSQRSWSCQLALHSGLSGWAGWLVRDPHLVLLHSHQWQAGTGNS